MILVAGPDQYRTPDLVMVSAAVPPPVVKLVPETVAVQAATRWCRTSVTVTVPRAALTVAPGAALPRFAVTGTLIESGPATTRVNRWVAAGPGVLPTVRVSG